MNKNEEPKRAPIDVAEASAIIASVMPRRPGQTVELAAACDRILAQSVTAERDQPPFDRVTMDGIAIACGSGGIPAARRFRRQGVQAAGAPRLQLADPVHCVEVMTGAVLPGGCDCVIPVERLIMDNEYAVVDREAIIKPGQFIHPSGSDYRAGDQLLAPGIWIGGPEMAVLASAGEKTVTVASLPSIGIVAVGDELVDPGDKIGPAQIRRSNDYAIAALLQRSGFGESARRKLPDDRQALREGIADALERCDIVVLTGGVSMGKYDYIPSIMSELGVKLLLHKVAQRPGRPMWFGRRGNRMVFALPGNPVSALVCARRYVVPAIERAMGYTAPLDTVPLGKPLRQPASLTWFVPVCLRPGAAGMVAEPRLTNTSGDFNALAGTTGFVELPADRKEFPVGYPATLWRW